MPPKS